MVYVEHGYLVSGLYPSSSVQKNKKDKNTKGICNRQHIVSTASLVNVAEDTLVKRADQ
jgi:hypothetical protein